MLFSFAITYWPCHVVTFQSAVRFSCAVLKFKTDADIKKVITLYVFPKLPLLFTMTLHLHHGSWRPIICPPYGALCNGQTGCITGSVCILLPELTYPQCFTRLPLVRLIQVPRVYLIWSPEPRYSSSSALPYIYSAAYILMGFKYLFYTLV